MINAFLTYMRCELNYSVHTVSSYSRDLRQWYQFAASAAIAGCKSVHDTPDPANVELNDLRLWIAFMSSEGVSARSIRRKIQSVRAFYKFLMLRHGFKRNPAAQLTPARLPKHLPSFIRPQQTKNILDTEFDKNDFIETRNNLILNTLYSTGMRCSELIGLLDSDIDLSRNELKVLGKRNKERTIPFGDELRTLIIDYRALRTATLHSVHAPTFFVRPNGQPLYRGLAYKIVHDALQGRVTAAKCSPHTLRHSFATDMLNNGADITAVQQLLGHQSLSTTQIYTHLSFKELLNNYTLAHPRAQKKKEE